ncbi:ABC transporter permease subunit [Mesorhizobium sp. M7A.F.Ca.US.006.04.2.1]|uniref:ABC transporter permease n=1 Tax=unclassified Mesorhizobium TaxID=325217 RepID=UPI000FCB3B85|nr:MULTISPECIES: ABC transporter permease subunit [unclassified Mesorhizobium]RUX76930.1 ABC transporter permease subunit [Mesorhizobium sp. M7A.F.Ca.US.005.03.1.1]RUY12519.1 ABC transporter permease subunit [Mesorhizobium sp. M7A.F.Ca.US.005.03.2.1]RUY26049.1 ABC transporter permease subunit [Mesorhizobium sp. M7A.F.Ca.US.001.04.2.1]RUY39181.1 ABC transporter permease subunit [Mesorhizobium sp. M7A.F.Ca.US.001.04.1.1]RVA90094.1 ABC transporter permease subunit [Mesorhizobium sp. M7A.F.Ca.US.0
METAWSKLQDFSPIDLGVIAANWPLFAKGFINTLLLVTLPLLLAVVIAIPLAVIRAQKLRVFNRVVFCYTYVFRGTPLLVQLYLLYYGVAQFEFVRHSFLWPVLRGAWGCAFLSITLCSAAYLTEILRGAIEGVPKGEVEAAKALGLSGVRLFWLIVFPSAWRRSLPPLSNEVIFTLHGSVVASTITIIDILGAGRMLNNKYYLAAEGLLTAAFLYLALTFLITAAFRQLERKYLSHLKPTRS